MRKVKPYIILNKEHSSVRPMYIRSVAMSSSKFDNGCIHTSGDLYSFYKKNPDCEIVFVKDAPEHEHFKELKKTWEEDKRALEREYTRVVENLNMLNESIYDTSV